MMTYTIYSQVGRQCPWCDKAAALLEEKGVAYQLRPLQKPELLEIARKASMTTVPIIYHGAALVGGHDSLVSYLSADADDKHVSIPLSTMKRWRELVDLNPGDLAPRLDQYITKAEKE